MVKLYETLIVPKGNYAGDAWRPRKYRGWKIIKITQRRYSTANQFSHNKLCRTCKENGTGHDT